MRTSLCPYLLLSATLAGVPLGCAVSSKAGPAATQAPVAPVASSVIQGKVFSARGPVAGAHVYLMAASTGALTPHASGYGNPSVSLLQASSTGYSDGVGAYVLTRADGTFVLEYVQDGTTANDYSCPSAETQVYLYALGGNAGDGTNSALGLLAALGNCGGIGSTSYFAVNELTTIATAYALAGFATGPASVSASGSAQAQAGLANAFANAGNLVDPATGTVLTVTPAGNGSVPQQEIDSLANTLESCAGSVNRSESNASTAISNSCETLFSYATADGTYSGALPTDTAAAAINIAHHPASQAANLYALSGTGAPFQPSLSAAPNDFTLSLSFSGGGLAGTDGASPNTLAVDAQGDVWAVSDQATVNGQGYLTEFSPLGVAMGPAVTQGSTQSTAPGGASGFAPAGLDSPVSVAVDADSANVWIADEYGGVVRFHVADGSAASFTGGLSQPSDVALDAAGNAWVSNYGNDTLTQLNGVTGAVLGVYSGNGLDGPYALAIGTGTGGKIWVVDANSGQASCFNSSGSAVSGSPFNIVGSYSAYTVAVDAGGGAWFPAYPAVIDLTGAASNDPVANGYAISSYDEGIAVDGAGNAWVTGSGSDTVYEFNSQGTLISGANGYVTMPDATPDAIAIDGSGDVWYNTSTDATLRELIGAAVPVVTPTAYAVAKGLLATRP
jgi:sugar lactone lactonase YvrE